MIVPARAAESAAFWLWRRLLPDSAPPFLVAFGAAVVGVIAILGIGFG